MSYDIGLICPPCEHCGRAESGGLNWNYTSNMVPAWLAAGVDLAKFDGKTAADCEPVLAKAIAVMSAKFDEYAQRYDDREQWGTMETLMPALEKLLRAFRRWPTCVVTVRH